MSYIDYAALSAESQAVHAHSSVIEELFIHFDAINYSIYVLTFQDIEAQKD